MTNTLSPPIWWSWDHTTNWILNQPGKQTYGANNDYGKDAAAFLEDYKRVIRGARDFGIEAIGIAGLLRDSHGGVETARQIVRYACEHNVRVYAISGLLAYGGVYYQGDSEWSLENFLKQNPECLAINKDASPLIKNFGMTGPRTISHGCSSNQKLMDFILRSIEWLFKSIPELGGLQFETGDTGVCHCEKCEKRRCLPSGEISLDDMALYYPKATETVLSANPDAWAICETYGHFLPGKSTPLEFGYGLPQEAIEALSAVPEEAFFQWVCDEWLNGEWTDETKVPLEKHRHIMRAHFSTYWMGSSRHRLEIDKIQRMCDLSASSGLDRVSIFCDNAPFHANDEFNYLAQVYFSKHPTGTIDSFIIDEMADRLGGGEQAFDYVEWNRQVISSGLDDDVFKKIASHALNGNAESRRRWLWLGSFLEAVDWDGKQANPLIIQG